jgi:hypothetical protein
VENIRGIQDPKRKKSFRFGLLLLSTLVIISASALVYASMAYEKALDVSGTTGSGSPASAEVSSTPAAIMILVVAGVVALSLFGFLRKVSKRVSNAPGGRGSSPTGPVSVSLEVPGIGLPLNLPSAQGDEWEESSTKKKGRE